MIGFNSNGLLTVQTLGNNGIYAISSSSSLLLLYQETHVAMTYSSTNGIRMFVNGILRNSNNTFIDYKGSGQMSTIIIGTCLQPNIYSNNQTQKSSHENYHQVKSIN
jgi:hypothetical protein